MSVLLLLLVASAWMLRGKLALISPRLAERLALHPQTSAEQSDASSPPKAAQAPDEISVAAADMPPLKPSTKPLLKPPAMPSRRASVVYLAFVQGPAHEQTTCSVTFEQVLRYHLRGALEDRLLINLIPSDYMREPYRRQDGSKDPTAQSPASYLDDALKLDADYAVITQVGQSKQPELPAVSLSVTDLKSSRTKEWSSASIQPAPLHFSDIMRATIQTCANFCGTMDSDIAQSHMLEGIPSDNTWNFLLGSPSNDDEIGFASAIESDPDCRVLYEIAWSWQKPFLYAELGLHKWPDDSRLLRRKAQTLSSADKPHAAFIYLSELIRRYPECILFAHDLPDIINKVLPETSKSTAAPSYWTASIDHLRNIAARFPKNWYLQWDTAYGINNFARFLRGGETVNKIPPEVLEQYGNAYSEAVTYIDKAAELRPDSANLLRAVVYMHYTAGHVDKDWQTQMIERIHQIDPSNYKAETVAAFSHSIGWGVEEDFWYFINMALKNHPDDPQAMYAIGSELGTELSRRMGWKAMTPEEVYKNPNPLSDKYIQCTEFALDHGVQVDKWMAGMLREMYRARYGEAKVQEIYNSGKHWGLTGEAANHAFKAGDYESTLRLASMALAKAPSRDERETQQNMVVKALWKLKRYDEALSQARSGISEFPEKPTFHYLYAVIASDKGGMDEEAYQEAYRAVDINWQTDAINSIYERLRAKLNKPQHPKLAKAA